MNELPQSWRMFIAIASPPELKEALKRTQQSLRVPMGASGIRWTSQEQFHLTLRFLGNVESSTVESLSTILREACRGFGPLRLQAKGVGFFPSARRPHVIWAGVSDNNGRLPELHGAIANATARFGEQEPENDFHGHITLGRVKHLSRREEAALVKVAQQFADTAFAEWKVDKLHLIRSELSSSGPTYTTIAEPSLL